MMGILDQRLAADIVYYENARAHGGTEVPRRQHEKILAEHVDLFGSQVAADALARLQESTAGTVPVSVHLTALRGFLDDTGFGPLTKAAHT